MIVLEVMISLQSMCIVQRIVKVGSFYRCHCQTFWVEME